MFIKSFLICMFIPSIIIDANESRIFGGKPVLENVTRGGKLFGIFAVPKKPIFPLYLTKNKHWRGAFIFSLGGYPVIATSVEYNHVHTKDPYCFFCLQHPQDINGQFGQQQLGNDGITNVNDVNPHISAQVQYDPLDNAIELPLNSTSISASASLSIPTASTTTVKTQETLRTSKLEDYDVITVDPFDKEDDDDVALNRVRREIQDEIESTTVDSSTQETTTISMSVTTMRQEELDNNHATTDSPSLELPQKPSQDFLSTTSGTFIMAGVHKYPASKYPSAEFISITQQPQDSYGFVPQIQPPVKSFYNFYPSQPDNSHYYRLNNFVPYCYANYGHGTSYSDSWANGPIKMEQNYIWK